MAGLRTGTVAPVRQATDDRGRWSAVLGAQSCVSFGTGDGTTARSATVWLLSAFTGVVWVGVQRGPVVLWLGSVQTPNLDGDATGLVFDWTLPQCDALVIETQNTGAAVLAVEVSPLVRHYTPQPSSSFVWEPGNRPQ